MRAGLTIRGHYAFFWRQWPSNWERSPFALNGVSYSCVEQWMMAEKARLFQDPTILEQIMSTESPELHKRYGRAVRGYDDARWTEARYEIVLRGTLEKYRQNLELRRLLLDTGELQLVEASPYDRIWGIGMDVTHPELLNESKWGLNLLGLAVTQARKMLKRE